MAVDTGTITFTDHFRRALTLTGTPEGGTGWMVTTTGTSPTHATVAGNGLRLKLSATSELARINLYQNNIFAYDIDEIQKIIWVAKVANVDAVSVVCLGACSTHNNDEDLIAESCWYKIEGADSTTNAVVESDDASTDNNDVATGDTLEGQAIKMEIDFTLGKDNITWTMDDTRVAKTTRFDMSNYGGGLQPYAKVEKASGTAQVQLDILKFEIQYKFTYG